MGRYSGRLLFISGGMALLAACSLAGPAVEPDEMELATREIEPTEVTEVATEVRGTATEAPATAAPWEPLIIIEDGWPVTQAQPGDRLELSVGIQVCCVFYEAVEGEVSWSVEPGDAASIDRAGVLVVDPGAPHGTVLTVTAVLAASGQTVTAPVAIYTPEANPLVGRWSEDVQFACETGEEISPPDPIRELIFRADQTVNVTWFPFEVYVDYWGGYAFNLERGTLSISVDGGNYVPTDLDGEGTFYIDEQGALVLVDIWLGTPPPRGQPGAGAPNCGHRFVR